MFVRGAAIGGRMGRTNLSRPSLGLLSSRPQMVQPRMAPLDRKGRPIPSGRTLMAACQATAVGIAIVALGAVMCAFGFYADVLSTESYTSHNGTVATSRLYGSRRIGLLSLPYLGPLVMAIGAFMLIFACVMTLEERDRQEAETIRSQKAKLAKAEGSVRRKQSQLKLKLTDTTAVTTPNPMALGQLNSCFIRDESKASAPPSRTDLPPPRRISSASCLPDTFGRTNVDPNIPLRQLLTDLKCQPDGRQVKCQPDGRQAPTAAMVTTAAEVHRGHLAPTAVWNEDEINRPIRRFLAQSIGHCAKAASCATVKSDPTDPTATQDWMLGARSLQDLNGNPTRRQFVINTTSDNGNFASTLAVGSPFVTPLDNRPNLPYLK